jgi:hypothetical protein
MRFIVGVLIVVAIICGFLMLVSSAALGTWTEHLPAIAILCLAFAMGIEVFGGGVSKV